MASRHESKDEWRIVLFGMTGVGKSTLGNAILGSEKFKTGTSPTSVTTEFQKKILEFKGKSLAVFDTPGLFHTDKSTKEVLKELLECIALTMPGPHVLLLVLSLAEFSREAKRMLEVFKKIFKEAKHHTIVVFTHKNLNEKTCEEFIESYTDLKNFINECCETYLEVGKTNNESQVEDLLKKIDAMVNENGSVYNGEMFEEAVKSFERKMKCDDTSGGDTEGAEKMDRNKWLSELLAAVDKTEDLLIEGMKKFTEIEEKAAYWCIQLLRQMWQT